MFVTERLCARERGRERGETSACVREREMKSKREMEMRKMREMFCVCVCMYERE